jgi:endonuclease/exonuclease/phosphatase family metal-dependent hydrolase
VTPSSTTIATWNVIHPYWGANFFEKEALTQEGLLLGQEVIREAITNNDWQQYNNWSQGRSEEVIEMVKAFSPDILSLQELSQEMTVDIVEGLDRYSIAVEDYHLGVDPVGEKTFGNVTIYNDTVTLLDTFYLEYDTGDCVRKSPVSIFDLAGRIVYVVNVHLKGYWTKNPNLIERQEQKITGYNELKTYYEAIEIKIQDEEDYKPDGIIINGDFNQGPPEQNFPYYRPKYLVDHGFKMDTNSQTTRPKSGQQIDWVFYKNVTEFGLAQEITPMNWEAIQNVMEEKPSDHYMSARKISWS